MAEVALPERSALEPPAPSLRRAPPTGRPPARGRLDWYGWGLAAAIGLGVLVRATLVFSRDFPLNDGALFYLMAGELEENDLRLPAFTTYNAAQIPFAYSPLGFYLAALLHAALPVPLIELFRLLPFVVSSMTVVAFALLARELLPNRETVLAAVTTFAVLPRSYLWLIMGGGLTRSLGFLFAICTIHQLYRMYTRRSWRYTWTTTLFASLTVLSHLGTAPFVAFSAALFFLMFGRHRHGVLASLVVAAGTVVLTAPWWATVATTHGVAPFLAASGTGGTIFTHERRNHVMGTIARLGLGTAEPLFPLIGTLAILGALPLLARRRYLLPAWWLTIILLDVRAGATYSSIPVAMLAGVAITQVIVPLATHGSLGGVGRRRRFAAAVLTIFLGYGIASAFVRAPHLGAEGRFLTSLTRDDRAAMAWVASATPPASRFLIVVGGATGGWWADRTSEWFPVLARRVSVATVQGTEWLPNRAFAVRERQYDAVQACAIWSARCLESWERRARLRYTHVYIPKSFARPCCAPLVAALRADSAYVLVYDGRAAAIFERLDGSQMSKEQGVTSEK